MLSSQSVGRLSPGNCRATVLVLGDQGDKKEKTGGGRDVRLGWPGSLTPGLWLRSSLGEQRAALCWWPPCQKTPRRGFPSTSAPKLSPLCFMAGKNKSLGLQAGPCQGLPCSPPLASGRCRRPQARLCCAGLPPWSHSKERMEVTSRTFDLICLFFARTESYCWNVTGRGSLCSRRCRAECWGKLVLRLVLTGLSPTVAAWGQRGTITQ